MSIQLQNAAKKPSKTRTEKDALDFTSWILLVTLVRAIPVTECSVIVSDQAGALSNSEIVTGHSEIGDRWRPSSNPGK